MQRTQRPRRRGRKRRLRRGRRRTLARRRSRGRGRKAAEAEAERGIGRRRGEAALAAAAAADAARRAAEAERQGAGKADTPALIELKRVRAVQKKLRQATVLREEQYAGRQLEEAQMQVASIGELQRELKGLEASIAREQQAPGMRRDVSDPATAAAPPADAAAADTAAAPAAPAALLLLTTAAAAPTVIRPGTSGVIRRAARLRQSADIRSRVGNVGCLVGKADLTLPSDSAPAPCRRRAAAAAASMAASSEVHGRPVPVPIVPPQADEEEEVASSKLTSTPKSPNRGRGGPNSGSGWKSSGRGFGSSHAPKAASGKSDEVLDRLYHFKSKASEAERSQAVAQGATRLGELRHLDTLRAGAHARAPGRVLIRAAAAVDAAPHLPKKPDGEPPAFVSLPPAMVAPPPPPLTTPAAPADATAATGAADATAPPPLAARWRPPATYRRYRRGTPSRSRRRRPMWRRSACSTRTSCRRRSTASSSGS